MFTSAYSVANIPQPFDLIRSSYPDTDRITLHIPLGDAVTATALGHLGFTLDSFLALRAGSAHTPLPSVNGFNIRAAQGQDAAKIANLHVQHIEDQLPTSAFVSTAALDSRDGVEDLEKRIREGATLYVAEYDKTVIGVIETSQFDVPNDGKLRRTPHGRAGVVQWVCVVPEYRGRGVGSALINTALNELNNSQVDYTYVFHGANNPLSTSQFWQRFGFCPTWGTWELNVE
ncbi:hypothetical protein GCM10014719_70540 [Planomonospora parontospora subsp. antibiotica]|nr:hypothetical protein GCM10014719_70540 [Planomonospora parontospora subsp. antibiotica]GII20281.1 hypothetical protein Ppa05_70070 [Planomonospora parontospora subsp. antibiotica]